MQDFWSGLLGQQVGMPYLQEDPYDDLSMAGFLRRPVGQLPYQGWGELANTMNSLYSQVSRSQMAARRGGQGGGTPLLGGAFDTRELFNPGVRLDPSQVIDTRGNPGWSWRDQLPWWQQQFPWERR